MEWLNLLDSAQFLESRPASRLLHDSEAMRVVTFCLLPGQLIESHVSPREVLMLVVEGRGSFLVGEEEKEARAGAMVVCAPLVPHGIKAVEKMVVVAVIAPRP